jgi:hypothetical protein
VAPCHERAGLCQRPAIGRELEAVEAAALGMPVVTANGVEIDGRRIQRDDGGLAPVER